tara:strand:+ start:2321 stop:2500 length:180 start_codon:yes stop_codon:yes gene_type:complete
MRTRFRNHRTFKNEKDANEFKEKMESLYPSIVFQVRRRLYPGKYRARYAVRSILKEGSK